MAKYKKTDKKFVNPYHFIPLEGECTRNIDYKKHLKQKDLKTGYIECEIKTLTPIFIPNTTNYDFFNVRKMVKNKEIKIKSYDFYSYNDLRGETGSNNQTFTPVIPGSSIRGTIRSAFEALTNSCMSTTSDNHVLYKRVTSPAKAGRLVKEGENWKIVKCERYGIKIKNIGDKKLNGNVIYRGNQGCVLTDNYNDKDIVYIKIGQDYPRVIRDRKNGGSQSITLFKEIAEISKTKTSECITKGYLHLGEPFGKRKHHESVFVETNHSFIVSKRDVENLLENYKLYQNDRVNLHKKQGEHNGYKSNITNAENSKINDLNGALIYYATHNGRYYLSPAAIGREVFHNRLNHLINSYAPCNSYDNLCPACVLFGFAGNESKSKKNAIASRIRFSDAKAVNYNFLNYVILPELAGPKASATEMYLKKPSLNNIAIWNYDYATKIDRNDVSYNPQIKGRKFYWHHQKMKTFNEENNKFPNGKKIDYSDRLTAVRPVDKDSKFKFKVHFNKITKDELEELCFVLSLANQESLAHKIGMGKPIGLGSVNIKINKITERKVSIENGEFEYNLEEYNCLNEGIEISDEVIDAFGDIATFNNDYNITYPYCVDDDGNIIPENYNWFVGNKQIAGEGGTGTKHVISQELPEIDNPKMEVIKKSEIYSGKIAFYNKEKEFGVVYCEGKKAFFNIATFNIRFNNELPEEGKQVTVKVNGKQVEKFL